MRHMTRSWIIDGFFREASLPVRTSIKTKMDWNRIWMVRVNFYQRLSIEPFVEATTLAFLERLFWGTSVPSKRYSLFVCAQGEKKIIDIGELRSLSIGVACIRGMKSQCHIYFCIILRLESLEMGPILVWFFELL